MEAWEAKMDIVLVELKHISAMLERLEAAYQGHVDHCKEEMGEVYDRLREVETSAELAKAFQEECHRRASTSPHWVYAAALTASVVLSVAAIFLGGGIKFH